jgi:membrane-associated phospholipid phosphatase
MHRRTPVLVTLATAAIAVGLAIPALTAAATPATTVSDAPGSGQSVIDWNQRLITILGTPGAQPATVHPTRSFAMLQAAEYDAVLSLTRAAPPYKAAVPAPDGARPDAAADQAAHDVLVALYPTARADLDTQLGGELAAMPDGQAKQDGVAVGAAAAKQIVDLRAADGSATAAAPFTAGTQPGDYRPTPPKNAAPMYTSWGAVTPFLLDSAQQFQPAAPPPMSSPEYTAALDEVRSVGRDSSTTRTPDQTVAGTFWSSAPVWNTWNQIAQQVAAERHDTLAQSTAAFATMDLALADTTIAMYDAKYVEHVWRPVTAVQVGAGDPTWNPLTPTAADPSYPGAHGALSAAAATALTAFYGAHQAVTVTSPGDAGVSRRFADLSGVADEAGLSRIWAGQHTRLDDEAGRQLGRQVGGVVLDDLQVHRADG